MPMGRGRTADSSEITVDADIDMLTYKLTGLGAPAATNDSLRYGQAEIRNAEIKAAAGIVYSKLALTGLIRNADIKSDAAIVESKLALNVGTSTLNTKIGTDIATHAALKTGIHGIAVARKSADQTVTNSETLVNDTHLLLAVGATDVWLIRLVLFNISVSAAPDIDYLFAVPSGGAVRILDKILSTTTADSWVDGTAEITMNAEIPERYLAFPFLYIGGGTAGNLQLQWAQHTATDEATTLKTNSLMLCHQIA